MSAAFDTSPPRHVPTFPIGAATAKIDTDALQRRTVRVLSAAQLAGGAGLAATATVGGLLAVSLSGTESVAGLPQAASIAGTAGAAVPLAALMRRRGRRPGLATGWLVGSLGAVAVLVATAASSLPILLAGMALTGVAQAAGDASRYAAADLAPPNRRGTAIGAVVFAVAVSTALGPTVAGPSAALVHPLGVPALAGPFAIAAVAFTAAALVLITSLRPDPLLVIGSRTTPTGSDGAPPRLPVRALVTQPAVRFALAGTAAANFVMVFLMTSTPLHLATHTHHGLGVVGLATSAHLAGMYAPSPLTGRLADRWDRRSVIALGAALLVVSGVVGILAPASAPVAVVSGVALLGVGWNLAFVAGSALLTDGVEPNQRASMQGTADAVMGIAGMLGGATSGVAFSLGGYPVLGAFTVAVSGCLLVSAIRRGR